MDNTEEFFSLLSTCFYICIVLSVLFFIVAIVLFFLFDIKTIFNIRTGRAKKKTISEMQAANNKTGRMKGNEKKSDLNESNNETEYLTNINSDNNCQQQALSKSEMAQTDVLKKEYAATDILDNRYRKDDYLSASNPTTPLTQEKGTENNNGASKAGLNFEDKSFKISKKVVIVHTNETIY